MYLLTGFLEKEGFFIALKLIALAQNGKEVSLLNIRDNTIPAPSMGDLLTQVDSWAIAGPEKAKWDQLFETLGPSGGLLSGERAKGVMMNYNLPVELLGKIWDMSDIDCDGNLDKDEFSVAMYLIKQAVDNEPLPSSLPEKIIPPSKRKKLRSESLSSLPPMPGSPLTSSPQHAPPVPSVPWVVTDKTMYDSLFMKLDTDHDSFVTGTDVRDTFLQSGLQQQVLALIWSLCDVGQTGRLNSEQFALAMYFVERALQGVEPPTQLTSEMMPPSLRVQVTYLKLV